MFLHKILYNGHLSMLSKTVIDTKSALTYAKTLQNVLAPTQ